MKRAWPKVKFRWTPRIALPGGRTWKPWPRTPTRKDFILSLARRHQPYREYGFQRRRMHGIEYGPGAKDRKRAIDHFGQRSEIKPISCRDLGSRPRERKRATRLNEMLH